MDKLKEALRIIGEDKNLREQFLKLCLQIEKKKARLDYDVRAEITAPIIDALYTQSEILMKKIKPDINFYFLYRSKISREFVMSTESEPDHVWEPQTTRLLLYFGQNAKHIAIGGAYSGDQAILLANSLKNTQGICHCFEPDKAQLDMIRYNAEKNKLTNLVFCSLGLWENDNSNLLLVGEDSLARSAITSEEDVKETFTTARLDSYGKMNNIPSFDVIMLDIEGAELSALKGAEFYLRQSPEKAPKIIFEVHRNYVNWDNGLENTEIVKYLKGMGYTVFALRDYQGHVPMAEYAIEIIKLNEVYLKGPPHGFNMIAVKDVRVLQNDLFKVCSGVSPKLLLHKDPSLHHPIYKLTKNK